MTERVGFIGLGVMGAPMARHLLAAGYPLTVHSRSAQPVDALVGEGARRATTPAEVASASDVVITMVPDTPDVELVLFGEAGVAEAAAAGSLVIDMSTIDPIRTRAFAERLAANGVAMLDAPVSGGQQVTRHRRAHHAEPDEADPFGHAARRRSDRRSRAPRR